MTLKAAVCPSCGGALQVSDDAAEVKCLYCGVDVVVREDARSEIESVEALTAAARNKTPSSISKLAKVLVGGGAFLLLLSIILLGQADYTSYGGLIMVISMVLIITGVANL